jgi:hypothetical protein
MKPVISVPPSSEDSHSIRVLGPTEVVVGVPGVAGMFATSIKISSEGSE